MEQRNPNGTGAPNKVLKPGELTEISLSQIALDPFAGNADVLAFDDPKSVLDEEVGDVSTVPGEIEILFESDSPIKGIDLRTALHNLNGDTFRKITFGPYLDSSKSQSLSRSNKSNHGAVLIGRPHDCYVCAGASEAFFAVELLLRSNRKKDQKSPALKKIEGAGIKNPVPCFYARRGN